MTNDPRGGFLRAVEEAARQSQDIDELAGRVRGFPGVHSVEVRDYLVKVEPPLRELAIEFQGSRFVADIVLRPDGSLTVRGLHE